MPVKTFRPLTPSSRYVTFADFSDITKSKPEKSLVEIRKKTGGRNHFGRATSRGIGGGHKQKIRLVDFRRNKHGVEATVEQRQKNVQGALRLFDQVRPDLEFQRLAWSAGVTPHRHV